MVSTSIADVPEATVVLSHVPPYNTAVDHHHHTIGRDDDLSCHHVGSVGLKLALRKQRPHAALSGHSHHHDYQLRIKDDERPHMLGLGILGVHSVSVSKTEGFGDETHRQG